MFAKFERKYESLKFIAEFVGQFSESNSLSSGIMNSLILVSEELFTNIIKYGTPSKAEIGIELKFSEGALILSLLDYSGECFFPPDYKYRVDNIPLKERTVGKLGLRLINSMTDKIDYELDQNCFKIKLTKHMETNNV